MAERGKRRMVTAEFRAQMRRVGFNDVVESDAGEIQVQTEITGRDPMRLRTTVHRQGAVLDVIVNELCDEANDVAHGTQQSVEQHQKTLALIRSGKYS